MEMDLLLSNIQDYGLFVALVIYVLYANQKTIKDVKEENEKRELRYIGIIDKLSDSFHDLKKEVTLIKKRLWNEE